MKIAYNPDARFDIEVSELELRRTERGRTLMAAIDMTLAPEAPYPASVQDANYGIRWLKSKAAAWKGDPATLGLLGSSAPC